MPPGPNGLRQDRGPEFPCVCTVALGSLERLGQRVARDISRGLDCLQALVQRQILLRNNVLLLSPVHTRGGDVGGGQLADLITCAPNVESQWPGYVHDVSARQLRAVGFREVLLYSL